MANIEGKGLPTRKTEGALGDIYTDTNTGNQYKCTGSFGITTHGHTTSEYEWTLWGKAEKLPDDVIETVRAMGRNGDICSKEMKELGDAVAEGFRDGINEVLKSNYETPVGYSNQKPARQNYGKHYKNNKNNAK